MTFAGDAQRWSEATFGQCNLGDKRLKARLIDYGARQAAAPAASTNQLAGGDAVLAEGMYRFMRNDRVEPSALAEGGFRHTASLCKGRELVLLPEDSTALSYTHSVAESLGDIGGSKGSKSREPTFIVCSLSMALPVRCWACWSSNDGYGRQTARAGPIAARTRTNRRKASNGSRLPSRSISVSGRWRT